LSVAVHGPDDQLHGGADGRHDRYRQLVAEAVVATFDAEDDQSPGQPADRAAECLRRTDPERVTADRSP
jgi:hypothetical protein